MEWIKALYKKTMRGAASYTAIFVTVMFLNQLLFFGLCLNPTCLVAATPHVLAITIIIGLWLYKPNRTVLKKTLLHVRNTYDEVKNVIERNNDGAVTNLFTGNVYLVVTQNKSKGEEDFQAVLARHIKSHISEVIRMDNRNKSKALLEAITRSEHLYKAGDIVAIVRGGGDTNDPQFDSYRDKETCEKIRNLADHRGVITVSGIGHSSDHFLVETSVNFAQITPTDAASRVVYLINGGKW